MRSPPTLPPSPPKKNWNLHMYNFFCIDDNKISQKSQIHFQERKFVKIMKNRDRKNAFANSDKR